MGPSAGVAMRFDVAANRGRMQGVEVEEEWAGIPTGLVTGEGPVPRPRGRGEKEVKGV